MNRQMLTSALAVRLVAEPEVETFAILRTRKIISKPPCRRIRLIGAEFYTPRGHLDAH